MRSTAATARSSIADRVLEIEPAFDDRGTRIAGATYTAEDESGDALKFTQSLAERCERMGADFHYNAQVTALGADRSTRHVDRVEVVESVRLSHIARARRRSSVSAAGRRRSCAHYGVRLNIYPAKGYSVTIPVDGSEPRTRDEPDR